MTGTKSMILKQTGTSGLRRLCLAAGHASRPGLSIPRGVAPQQSSTPLPQTAIKLTQSEVHKNIADTQVASVSFEETPAGLASSRCHFGARKTVSLNWTALPGGVVEQTNTCQAPGLSRNRRVRSWVPTKRMCRGAAGAGKFVTRSKTVTGTATHKNVCDRTRNQ